MALRAWSSAPRGSPLWNESRARSNSAWLCRSMLCGPPACLFTQPTASAASAIETPATHTRRAHRVCSDTTFSTNFFLCTEQVEERAQRTEIGDGHGFAGNAQVFLIAQARHDALDQVDVQADSVAEIDRA